MSYIVELGLGTAVILACAVGCGGSDTSSGTSTGGTSSSSGGASGAVGGTSSSSGGTSASNGGASPSGGSFSTTVPASTNLGSLTSAQATQLCADLSKFTNGAFSNELGTFTCNSLAVVSAIGASTDAAAQAACKMAESSCKATPTMPTMSTCMAPNSTTCTATVGDLEACLNDITKTFATLGASIPACATLTVAQVTAFLASEQDGGTAGLVEPASCVTFDTKCPDSSMLPPSM